MKNSFTYKLFIYALLLISTLFTVQVLAQDVELKATVNKNTIVLNENIEYRLEVSGKKTDLPEPNLPEFDGLAPLSGPNTSTSIQFVNGNMSASKVYSYILQATRTGTIKIAPATIKLNDEVISSNEITLTVGKASAQQQQPSSQVQKSTSDPDISGDNLFLKAITDKRSAYQNEQILVTYKLYFRVSVRSYNVDKIPATTGFWTEEFKLPTQPPIENEVVNGVAYQVATLRQVALFATQSGALEIDPMTITVDALIKRQTRSRSIFDSFFDDPFGRTVRKSISSKPIKINIIPLPDQGKPADFSGTVGRYSLKLSSDKSQLKANEAASIKIQISGEGNIKLLKPPVLQLPGKMEVYDPKENTDIKRDAHTISGSKSVEYIVVPRFEGEFTIKPVSFSYFDPRLKRYQRLSSDPVQLTILPGDASAGSSLAAGNLSRQEVELLGEDIRFIKENAEFIASDVTIYKRWYYISLYLVSLAGLGLAWMYARQNKKIRSDAGLARRRKAAKLAGKHMVLAQKYMKTDHAKDFYRELSLALQGFVCDKLNLQMTDFNAILAQEKLTLAGVEEKLISDYTTCLQENDFRQFAGDTNGQAHMNLTYNNAKKIIDQLEKYL